MFIGIVYAINTAITITINTIYTISITIMSITFLHLFSFKTPILLGKKIIKSVKSIVGISPTMVLLFHLPCFYLKM